MQGTEAPDPCISMALEALTASGRVQRGWGSSAGLSCMAVLPAGHRLNPERIAYPLAALPCLYCVQILGQAANMA